MNSSVRSSAFMPLAGKMRGLSLAGILFSMVDVLKDYPTDMVRLACAICPRECQYSKDALLEKFGEGFPLASLRHLIAKCDRLDKRGTACGVYYVDLNPPIQ
jgi:hypothetical protein